MRRLPALAFAFVLTTAVLAAPAHAKKRFSLGVAAGEVTSSSAIVWTRAPRAGKVRLIVLEAKASVPTSPAFKVLFASRKHDLTVSVTVGHLRPGRTYIYRFIQGSWVSPEGRFKTPPARTKNATVRFAVSGDADAQKAPGARRPYYNAFEVYGRMAAERNDFNVNLGDTIYSDSEVPGAGAPALSVAAKWAKYRQNIALANLQKVRSAAAFFSHWDDHEFINDFTRSENDVNGLYAKGKQAFTDYAPVRVGALGLYRSVRWGANLEVFLLDLRSFRSAKASTNAACTNSTTHLPDLAPTVPQLIRAGTGIPALAASVPQACLDEIASPTRTMLGAAQYAAFTTAIKASTARFKVILTEDPIQQFYALPYDRWEGYADERSKLLHFLADNVKNVVFVATDTHANFVNDVRFETLNGPRLDSGMTEVVTGPVATMTFAKEIDSALGAPGASTAIVRDLLRAPLIGGFLPGIAMHCAAVNTYSYAEVTATATTLTIDLKDLRGAAVKDDVTHQPCAPVTLTYTP